MRSPRQKFGELKLIVLFVIFMRRLQCLSIMYFEWRSEMSGSIVYMFFTRSFSATNAFHGRISLFYGFYGLVCFVWISLICATRLSVSILSHSVSFHALNWLSTIEMRSHMYFR